MMLEIQLETSPLIHHKNRIGAGSQPQSELAEYLMIGLNQAMDSSAAVPVQNEQKPK